MERPHVHAISQDEGLWGYNSKNTPPPHTHLPMEIVDGVAPVILNMPAEAREAHAHISPGHLHPRYISVHVTQHRPLGIGKVVQVPAGVGIVLLLRGGRLLLHGEATAYLTGQQVSSILHHYLPREI